MILQLTAQAGSRRAECGLSAEHSGYAQLHRPRRVGRRHYFGGVPPRSPYGAQGAARCGLIHRLHLAAVIEGTVSSVAVKRHQARVSDLSRSSTLPDSTDKRMSVMDWRIPVGATSWSGDGMAYGPCQPSMTPHFRRNLGNPRAEKVRPHRLRQNKGAAMLTKAPSAFRKIGNAVIASEPDACAGVGSPRQGTLTITGSNVRLGTEMPVALSLF